MSHLFKYVSKLDLIVNHIIVQGSSSEELQPQVSAYSHTGNPLSKACYFVTFSCLQPLFSICLVNIENSHPLKPGNVTFSPAGAAAQEKMPPAWLWARQRVDYFFSTQNFIVTIATWLLVFYFAWLFLRPNIFETDTETFFETKIFRDWYWDFFLD